MAEKKKAVAKKAVAKKAPAKKAVAKKAVAKKAVAKKAPAKKAPAKKAPAKKVAVKKAVAKKAPAKKAVAKKTVTKITPAKKVATKKAVAKKTPVRKAPSRTSTRVVSFDAISSIPEVPGNYKQVQKVETAPVRELSSPRTAAEPAQKVTGKNRKAHFVLVTLALFGGLAYFLISNNSIGATSEQTPDPSPTEIAAPIESKSPTPEATPELTSVATAEEPSEVRKNSVQASFIYTSTGIRLDWKGDLSDASSIVVESSEDETGFKELTTLPAQSQSLRITKIDTKGWTEFRVTVTPVEGEPYSSTVGLRGRFTL